jgi:NAD(P)-dependent dehydrogenase (short-subunit alcohol dehydrogenase family)
MSNGLRVFDGSVVLITGGASGIGAAIGKEVARRGATAVLADRQSEEAEQVSAEIRQAGGKAEAHPLDVTDWTAVKGWVEASAHRHGRLDYLFNNAGIGVGGEAAYYALDDWLRVLDVNLNGVIYGVQAAYPIMIGQRFGHIVNTASMAGLVPSPGVLGYTTSKHAVVGLSRALRIEAEEYGVRVSVMCPGVIRTPIIEGGKFGSVAGPTDSSVLKDIFEKLRPMDVDLFARRALDDVARNRSIIIHPGGWRWGYRLSRWFPWLGEAAGRQNVSEIRKRSKLAAGSVSK